VTAIHKHEGYEKPKDSHTKADKHCKQIM